MNLTLLAVDKMREPYLRDGCERLEAKLSPYLPVDIVEVKPQSKEDEGTSLLARIDADSIVWVLEREGTLLSSPQLARRLADVERSGKRRLTIVVGGSDGLDRSVVERADFAWSLSPLTFLHEMARLIALEQLFRAVKINRGEPYHR
jgi:23S rRNA (pseudouridine1915-N3)-methyltransferase